MIRILLTCPACSRLCSFSSRVIRAGTSLPCPGCGGEFTCDSAVLNRAIRQLTSRKTSTARLR